MGWWGVNECHQMAENPGGTNVTTPFLRSVSKRAAKEKSNVGYQFISLKNI